MNIYIYESKFSVALFIHRDCTNYSISDREPRMATLTFTVSGLWTAFVYLSIDLWNAAPPPPPQHTHTHTFTWSSV